MNNDHVLGYFLKLGDTLSPLAKGLVFLTAIAKLAIMKSFLGYLLVKLFI